METAARPTGIATVSVGDGAWPDIGNDAPNHTSTTCSTGMEDTEGPGWPGYGAGGRWQGLQDNEPTSTTHQHTDPTGVGSAGGSGGHGWPGPTAPGIPARQGCGARGRRQGLAGQRDDTPSEARSADGSRAGRRPRAQAHQAARLSKRAGRSTSITTTPQVWRAPEGPEGTGGLRGAAPSEARSPSLAGSRSLRCSEHPWGLKRLRLGTLSARLARNALAARFAQGQAAVAVDGRTHVDEAWARQERRVGAGAELADGV